MEILVLNSKKMADIIDFKWITISHYNRVKLSDSILIEGIKSARKNICLYIYDRSYIYINHLFEINNNVLIKRK